MKTKSVGRSRTKEVPKVEKRAISAAAIKKTLKKVIEKDLLPVATANNRRARNVKGKIIKEEPVTPQHETKRLKVSNDHAAAGGSQDKQSGRASKRRKTSLLEIPKIPIQEGTVFVCGENDCKQLGFESVQSRKRPAELTLNWPVVDIVAGGMHSVCLTSTGQVCTFGCNDEGALGRNQTDDDSEALPDIIDLPEKIVMISAGDSHSAALSETGNVYIWGNFRNGNGSMGLTQDGQKRTTPIRILKNVQVVKIASGADHLVCLSTEGVVYTCGCGENGQLGRISPRSASDGGRKGGMESLLCPREVRVAGKERKFDNIWAGSFVSFMRERNSGVIYGFGLNNCHNLGYECHKTEIARFAPKRITTFRDDTESISADMHHTLSLDRKGHVYAVGRHEYGRLGLGSDGGDATQPTPIPSLEYENCTNISCGNCSSFAVSMGGKVYSWGMGNNCQLGHGNDEDYSVPTVIEGNLTSWHVFKVSSGGQHTIILAHKKDT